MRAPIRRLESLSSALVAVALVTGCQLGTGSSPTSPSCPASDAAGRTAGARPSGSDGGDIVIVGRIVTMADPPIAEGLLIEEGLVTCVGTRDEVMARASEEVPVVDIGSNVAYPGFIDAHAHWIGDRDYYGLDSAQEAVDAAVSRGWTSISEQWVNRERLAELESLAADDALPIRVDAYLALNFGDEFFGDWYSSREPGPFGDRLRVNGLKIHLDDGRGEVINWEADDVTGAIGRADEAGWQVSVHTVSTEAEDLVLDAFEAALGTVGPNPLHHRIEHAIEVTDDQLARMVAMDLVIVVHLDGGAADWVLWNDYMGQGMDYPVEQVAWLTRMRDFIEAGLHVAAATDAPWSFPDFAMTDDIGRPVDQIAGGMDGRGRAFSEVPDWILGQLLTAEQGLRAVTVDAAYAIGDEANRGRLAVGTYGDVTILSGSFVDATPDELRALDVVATIVDGSVVFCSDADICRAD